MLRLILPPETLMDLSETFNTVKFFYKTFYSVRILLLKGVKGQLPQIENPPGCSLWGCFKISLDHHRAADWPTE